MMTREEAVQKSAKKLYKAFIAELVKGGGNDKSIKKWARKQTEKTFRNIEESMRDYEWPDEADMPPGKGKGK